MSRITTIALIMAVGLCTLGSAAWAQEPGMDKEGMRPDYEQRRQQMMEKVEAQDAKLNELVTAMNAAEGAAKVDAIAAVVNELVAQRTEMRGHMGRMRKGKGGGKHKGHKQPEAKAPEPTS